MRARTMSEWWHQFSNDRVTIYVWRGCEEVGNVTHGRLQSIYTYKGPCILRPHPFDQKKYGLKL